MKWLMNVFLIVSLAIVCPTSHAAIVAYYPFDGNANDASGNGYNATVHGATLCPDRFGVADHAYYFDGTGYIEADGIPNANGPVTFAEWLYMDSPQVGWVLQSANFGLTVYDVTGSDPPNTEQLHLQARVYAPGDSDWPGGTRHYATSTEVFQAGTWAYVAGVYDGTGLTLYVNGDVAGYVAGPTSLVQSTWPLYIGSDVMNIGRGPNALHCRVDDVRIYDSALSQDEIRQAMGNVPEPSTIIIWSLLGALAITAGWRRLRKAA